MRLRAWTVEQFRLLRDGGDVVDPDTGEAVRFPGQLFDPVVFDDSVREFIDLRGRLANYFDESLEEDIFDYVPPQRTNQIFTPRNVVVEMVDLFEKENPGCFDDPGHTFARPVHEIRHVHHRDHQAAVQKRADAGALPR